MSDSLQGNEDDIQLFLRIKIKLIFILYSLQDTYGCVGWTWTDEENQDIAANCLMFSHLGELTQYQNCVRQESIPLKSA